MATKRWQPGTVIRKTLDDGATYYGHLLEFPWVAFYHRRTPDPDDQLAVIAASPVAFTISAHKTLLAKGEWELLGRAPLPDGVHPPKEQAIWDDADHCQIIDLDDNMRAATPAECEHLEVAAVWEPENISKRLRDTLAGHPQRWKDELIPRRGPAKP